MKVNQYNATDNELAYIHSLSCSLIFLKRFDEMIVGVFLICFPFSVNFFSIEFTVYILNLKQNSKLTAFLFLF